MGPDEVEARFQHNANTYSPNTYSLSVLWTSFTAGTTILRTTPRLEADRHLAIAEQVPPVGYDEIQSYSQRFEQVVRLDGKERALIIGHPGGRDLRFSIGDNVILDSDDRVVHYRAPTEPGSSGSPVFNDRWEVIAMHYAGRTDTPRLHALPGTYAANEGIRIDFIRAQIAAGVQAASLNQRNYQNDRT